MSRCLYTSGFKGFMNNVGNAIFGTLCDRYHGEALTTTREAWRGEIAIMKDVLSAFDSKDGQVIFEYDITRLRKRVDPEKGVKMESAGFGEVEHVAIFDEAQRSWIHKRLADYLNRGGTYGNKLKVPNFPMSEAAFLIWSLDQRKDWATIACLVGGGQEINTGEAGISEWINALNEQFPHWDIFILPQLIKPECAEGKVNELLKDNPNATYAESLHSGTHLCYRN